MGIQENEKISKEHVRLKRKLGLLDTCATMVGMILGTGIFIAPKGVLLSAGSVGLSLVIWGISGTLCMLGALSYIELGTRFPKAGGEYAYITQLYGDLAGFLHMWCSAVFFLPASMGAVALGFGHYVTKPFFPDCEVPNSAVVIIAVAVIWITTFVNCVSVKSSMLLQKISSLAVISLVVIAITGVVTLSMGRHENFKNVFDGTNSNFKEVVIGLHFGIYSFSGWASANTMIEEIKNPYRTLPAAILTSIPLLIVIYMVTNVAYFAVLTPQQILETDAVAVTFGVQVFGVVAWLVPVMIILSCLAGINSGVLYLSRQYFAGAREGHLPSILNLININSFTPFTAAIVQAFQQIVMILLIDVYSLIVYSTFLDVVIDVSPVLAIIYRKIKYPKEQVPFKTPLLVHVLFSLGYLFLMFVTLIEKPVSALIGLTIVLTGLPFYFIFIHRKYKITSTTWRSVVVTIQMITMSVPEDVQSPEEQSANMV